MDRFFVFRYKVKSCLILSPISTAFNSTFINKVKKKKKDFHVLTFSFFSIFNKLSRYIKQIANNIREKLEKQLQKYYKNEAIEKHFKRRRKNLHSHSSVSTIKMKCIQISVNFPKTENSVFKKSWFHRKKGNVFHTK